MNTGSIVVLLALLVACVHSTTSAYNDRQIIRLKLENVDTEELRAQNPEIDIHAVRGDVIDLMVNPSSLENLKALGLPFETIIDNVAKHLERNRPRSHKEAPWQTVGRYNGFFDTFRPYNEIEAYINQLQANYSRILTKFTAGTTFEGRTIWGLKLSSGGSNKPTLYFQANVHAREWLAPATNLFVLTSFVEDYEAGLPDATRVINKYDLYFVPTVNIDGYIYTWTNDRYWRKNRRVNAGSSAIGVDINRNWGPDSTWCTAGSSTLPASDTYCGTAPFSEPETSSMRNWIDSLPNLAAAIDFHSYGPLLLYPFQYSYRAAPEPYNAYVKQLGDKMETTIRSVHNEPYENIQGSQLYPHSGGMIDYVYFAREVASFTIELRGNDFVVPDSYILLAGEEIYPAIIVLADNA